MAKLKKRSEKWNHQTLATKNSKKEKKQQENVLTKKTSKCFFKLKERSYFQCSH
ncbi:MAG: hypothetical protein E7H35_06045 [Peptoniphilus harei]|nr:hypothetical protein [Peptoniphilus harei]